jgi:outer membrane protein assembly factor BamA
MIYNAANRGKINGAKKWIMDNLGEAPVIYDSLLADYSSEQMQEYLFNKGFLDAVVTHKARIQRRKASVTYSIITGKLYLIDTVIIERNGNVLSGYIRRYMPETLLKRGSPLSLDLINQENKRIESALNNAGFYKFSANAIKFDADTSAGYNKVKLYMRVLEDTLRGNTKRYYLRRFNIYSDFNAIQLNPSPFRLQYDAYYFYYDSMRVRNEVIRNVIFMSGGQLFSRKDLNYTNNRLTDLGVFKFINIRFNEVGKDSLDCIIRLTPGKRRIIGGELEGNNVESSVGSLLRFYYKNLNWGRRANKLDYSINAGTEIPLLSTGNPIIDASMQFNATFPKFYSPFLSGKISPYFNAKTKLTLSLNYQLRSGVYRLGSYNFSFGYDWRESITKRHQLNPLTLTVLQSLPLSDAFREQLDLDPQLKLSFQNQIISGANYTFTFSNQTSDNSKSFTYFKAYIETSGFTVKAVQSMLAIKPNSTDGITRIAGSPYSNFVKTDYDLRRYIKFGENRTLVLRGFAGVGFHFWNSASSIPFIKQYYAGGTNDIRAWRIRYLGPGSFNIYTQSDTTLTRVFVNQTSEMKLEANLEYRFGIFGLLKGALFTDAGNIWSVKKKENQPNGNFDLSRFYNEIAIGSGFGLRLDFSFFIFRLDMAVPVRDPIAYRFGSKWIFNSSQIDSWKTFRGLIIYNLAIGYPF